MAGFKSNYFKIGDKFDESRFAIIRNEEVDGVTQTSVVKVGVEFLGCTLLPGIGLKSPEPDNLVLLYDGSFLQYDQSGRPIKHLRVTGGNVSEDEIEYGKDGTATLRLSTGAPIALSTTGEIAKIDDKGKIQEMKQIVLDEKAIEEGNKEAESIGVAILEEIKRSKAKPLDESQIDKDAPTETHSSNEVNGIKQDIIGKVSLADKITPSLANDEDGPVMFSLKKPEGEAMVAIAELTDNGVDKFLYFSPTADIVDFFGTEEGQKLISSKAVEIIGEGGSAQYRFRAKSCLNMNSGCFEVEGQEGVKFYCNNGMVSLAFGSGSNTFVSRITGEPKKGAKSVKVKGYECDISRALNKKCRSREENGYSLKNQSVAEILKRPDIVLEMLKSDGQVDESNITRYDDEELSVFACALATSGKEKLVLFAQDKASGKTYALHSGSFVELNPERRQEITEADPTKGRFKFSPKRNSQGHYVSLSYDTAHDPIQAKRVEELSRFLGEKGTSVKQDKVLNAHSNEEFATELSSTIRPTTARYSVTGLEPKQAPERQIEEPVKNPEEPKKKEEEPKKEEPKKKGDPKKGTAFWNVISNAMFYAMFFALIACAFGLGFVALPFALGFAAAGLVAKGIAYQGGFAANMTEEEYQNALAAAKEKSADKNLTRAQRKYKQRQSVIDKNNAKIAELEAKYEDFKSKGLDGSKDAIAIKAQLEILRKENEKLDKKQIKAEKKFTPLEALELMGKRPEIKEVDLETTRDGFGKNERLYGSMVENLLGQELLMERQGHTMDPIFGQVDFGTQKYMLNANSVSFMNELTPAERMQVWGTVSELEERYGGQQNNKFVEIFVEHDMLRQKIASKAATPEEQKKYEQLSQTIITAQKDMGEKMFEEWSTFIRGEARNRYEHIANEYGITDVQTARSLVGHQKTIERLAGKTDRTPEEEAELQTAREEVEAAQRTIGEHSFEIEREAALAEARANGGKTILTATGTTTTLTVEQIEKRYSNPDFIEDRISHYATTYYPKLVYDLDKGSSRAKDKSGNVFNASSNPLTIRTQLFDEYISVLENKAIVSEAFEDVIEEEKMAVAVLTQAEAFKEVEKEFSTTTVTEMLKRTSIVDSMVTMAQVGLSFENAFGNLKHNFEGPGARYRHTFNPQNARIDSEKVQSFLQRDDVREKFISEAALEEEHSYELDHKTFEKYKKQGVDLMEYVKYQKTLEELGKKPETELTDDERKMLAEAEDYMTKAGDLLISEEELEDIRDHTAGGETEIKKQVDKLRKKKLKKVDMDLKKNNLAAHIEELNRISAKYDINAYDLARAEQTIRTLGSKEGLSKQEEKLLAQARATREAIAMKAAQTRAFENGFEAFLKRNGIEDGKNVDQKTLEKLKKDYKRKYKQKFDGKEHQVAYGQEVLNEIYVELEENNLLGPKPNAVKEMQATTLADTDSEIDKLKKKTKLSADEQRELQDLERRRAQIQEAIEEQAIKKDFEKYLEEYCKRNNITDKEKVRKKAWAYYKKTLKDKSKRKKINEEAMAEIMDEMKKQGVFVDEKDDEEVLTDDDTGRTDGDSHEEEDDKDKDKDKDDKDATTSSSRRKKKTKEPEKTDDAVVTSVYGEGEAPKAETGEYDMAGGGTEKTDPKKKKQQKKGKSSGRTAGK